jgi:RNA polymerase sigma factor (sigma-70 family)
MSANAISPEIIRAAISGNQTAIESLLTVAQPDIRRYAVYYCLSREDAEDAAQETLWQLYRRIGALRAVAAFPAWLMMIVRRECNRLMGKRHHQPLLDDSALDQRPEVELRLDVAAAIESLPENYRQVVVLRDLQNMTVDEIVAELDLTREAVKGRLHRARDLMREYLAD